MSRKSALEVLVFGATGFKGSFVFRTPKVTLGRAPDAMVRLDDPQVSLQHATLTLDGGLFRIKDNGSRTGTRINGAPILPRQPVEPTDEIAIGPFRLRVTMCDPDEDEATTHGSRKSTEDATNPLASLFADLQRPTAEPFFPPSAGGKNGGDVHHERAPAPARDARNERAPAPAREARRPDPLARLAMEEMDLADSGEATLVRGSSAPPPFAPPVSARPSARPQANPVRTPATALIPQPQRLPQELLEPPPSVQARAPAPERRPAERARPDRAPSQRAPSERPPAYAPAAAAAVSERPAKVSPHHLDTALDVVPAAYSFPHPDDEPAGRVDVDEDEDDDSNFVPAFDLLDELTARSVDEETARGEALSLEIVHSRGNRILSVHHPKAIGPLCVRGLPQVFGSIGSDGTVALDPEACPHIRLTQGREELSPAKLAAKSPGRLAFLVGMQATYELDEDDKVLIYWVRRASALAVPPLEIRPSRGGLASGGSSFAIHIAAAILLASAVFGDSDRSNEDINAGRFATISTKELELEPPPPPPPPPDPAPTVDNAPTVEIPSNPHDVKAQAKSKVAVKGASHAAASDGPPSNTPSASTQKILSALGGATSSANAIAVTNLDALPSGVGGDFKVSGALGKAPGDTLRVAAAGSGAKDVDTKTASELGGNKLGRVQGQTGGGAVRARVSAAPQAVRGEGHLDRGEIQKVVNAHLYQVQGCYERQLAKDPSLSGKIAFEWDVGLTGGVSNVRVGRSSVHSVEVTTCIQQAIQGWHFPTPQGGTVTVTYPFAFSALGG